ncbi:DUF2182 domain-containing protein [Labrenzia sp. PHM005]|uniref:DUF2182 domain-containing protein n=1 Tax=Labrenzia sp. PHM005 TaxID=2590016 RepID=UPI001AD8FBCB|nr:DUF2182 domain-containing protein [Labrenzia sp. PHM005]
MRQINWLRDECRYHVDKTPSQASLTIGTMPALNTYETSTAQKPETVRGWPLVIVVVAALAISGWAYLIAMVAAMVPVMDMAEAGPGMSLLNQFNIFRGLPDDARAALAVLCLPAGATFGMPSVELTWVDVGKIFLMWAMMALAMMLPSATPMLKSFHRHISKHRSGPGLNVISTVFVVSGYLAVWLGYAIVATLAQVGLSKLGALSDMMAPVSLALTASVLIAAGIYQFTPAKTACLQRCWYPRWSFAKNTGRYGISDSVKEGIAQGWICLGCCWAVMTVMFAVGLMNILWIALLGVVMALEKTFPSRFFPTAIGVFLLIWGGALALSIVLGGPATPS